MLGPCCWFYELPSRPHARRNQTVTQDSRTAGQVSFQPTSGTANLRSCYSYVSVCRINLSSKWATTSGVIFEQHVATLCSASTLCSAASFSCPGLWAFFGSSLLCLGVAPCHASTQGVSWPISVLGACSLVVGLL